MPHQYISAIGIGRSKVTKGLVINYREGGGGKNGKIAGPKLFEAPLPPQNRVKLFTSPFKDWKLFAPPPPRPQYG